MPFAREWQFPGDTSAECGAPAMMPTLTHPWTMAFLAMLPPLAWWWLRQQRGAVRYPGTTLLGKLPAGCSRRARYGSLLLRCLGLALLITAMAGPRWPDLRSRVPTEGIAIEMVVDVSGSMAERDYQWMGQAISRLDAVKQVFSLFVAGGELPGGGRLEGRASDLLGLVVFGTDAESPCPLTLSHSTLLQMLQAEKPREGDAARTNLSDGIVRALLRLRDAKPRRKVIILFSDGEHNIPKEATKSEMLPREAAQLAGSLGVVIHTIDAGGTTPSISEPGVAESSATTRDQGRKTLHELAHITHGEYSEARDTNTLGEVCRRIDGLERDPIESFQYRRYHEAYPWFGLAALACLGGVYFLELTWWRRVP